MSERMIQRHRERLLAAGKGGRAASGANGAQVSHHRPQQARQTPQQAAASAMESEDVLFDRFLQRMHHRNDNVEGSIRSPTVPTALARRALNRQGAGFLDGAVAAIASAAGDRFLATVLQQAVACRDQRLKGAEVLREAARTRKRHLQQVQADADDRERRRMEKAAKREQTLMATVQAGDAIKKTAASASAAAASAPSADGNDPESSATKSKKKKKTDVDAPLPNGAKLKKLNLEDEEEDGYDSVDEEEEYYQRYYGDAGGVMEEDEEDDEEEALALRDLALPLEAWGFSLSGKAGLLPTSQESDGEGEVVEEDGQEPNGEAVDDILDSEDEDDGTDGAAKKNAPSEKVDKKKSPQEKKRNTASPVPGASSAGGATT